MKTDLLKTPKSKTANLHLINPDLFYIEGLREDIPWIVKEIYDKFEALFINRLVKWGCSREEAKDVFSRSLEITLLCVRKPGFQLTSKFSSFLWGICRRVWSQYRRKYHRETLIENIPEFEIPADPFEDSSRDEKNQWVRKKVSLLSPQGRKILFLSLVDKRKMKEIAQEMNLKNDQVARVKKYRIQKKLKSLLMEDKHLFNLGASEDKNQSKR